MSREEETRRVIEYYLKINHTNTDSNILAEIAISLAMIVDILKESEPYKGMTNGQVHDMLYRMLVKLKNGADR